VEQRGFQAGPRVSRLACGRVAKETAAQASTPLTFLPLASLETRGPQEEMPDFVMDDPFRHKGPARRSYLSSILAPASSSFCLANAFSFPQ